MANVIDLEEQALDLGQSLKDAKEELNTVLDNPKSTNEDIKAAQAKVNNRQLRYDTKRQLIKETEEEQKLNLKAQKRNKPVAKMPNDPKQKMIKAEAAWIRKIVRPGNNEYMEKWNGIKEELQDDDDTKGADLLPVNVSNQLVTEPLAKNPLRNLETISTITDLILPKVAFEIADDGFVKDGEAAKDAKITGDQITFGRFQMKVRAGISDTILRGTDTNLVSYVNNALASAIQKKERTVSLGTSNPADEAHMSYYDASNNIKHISGSDLFHAIRMALADLDDDYQDQAQILMTRTDYYNMIDSLANDSTTLYGRQPQEILGAPVTFTSAATKPIVGDFAYGRLNYEISRSLYEQYKDYDKGMNYFQYTTWFDHRIVQPLAFRIADVGDSAAGGNKGK